MKRHGVFVGSLLGALALLPLPAHAQIQPGGSMSVGNTPIIGGTNGRCLYDNAGKLGEQVCGASAGIGIGTSAITGGTTGRVLYDNAGVVGELSTNGSGNVLLSAGTAAIASGKTLTASNTVTLTATDGSTLAIGTGGTLGTAAYQSTGTSGATVPLLSTSNTWTGSQTIGTGSGVVGLTVNGGSSGSGNGPILTISAGGSAVGALGNASAILGGAYDATQLWYGGVSAMAIRGSGTTGCSSGIQTAATTGVISCVTSLLGTANTWALAQTFTVAPIFTDQSGSRTALGLGTAATAATGTSGATLPFLNGTNTWGGVQTFSDGNMLVGGATSGTLQLRAAATSGTSVVRFPNGSTDFSATGGASQFVKQNSAGAALTVVQPAFTDLSGTISNAQLGVAPTAWTPADNSGAALTFTGVSANYVRMGNMILAYTQFNYPVTADASNAGISGLPVTAANADYAQSGCVVTFTNSSTLKQALLAKATQTVLFYAGGSATRATNAQLSGAQVNLLCNYPVA